MNDITIPELIFALVFSYLFITITEKLGIADPIFDFIYKVFGIPDEDK